jgi:hypothetical protein
MEIANLLCIQNQITYGVTPRLTDSIVQRQCLIAKAQQDLLDRFLPSYPHYRLVSPTTTKYTERIRLGAYKRGRKPS